MHVLVDVENSTSAGHVGHVVDEELLLEDQQAGAAHTADHFVRRHEQRRADE